MQTNLDLLVIIRQGAALKHRVLTEKKVDESVLDFNIPLKNL
jgi:hypothetical protein